MGIIDTITGKATELKDSAVNKAEQVYKSAAAKLPPPFKGKLYTPRGDGKSPNAGDYELASMSFPADITNNPEYGGNYVVFYINVNIESKMGKNDSIAKIPDNMVQRDRGALIAMNQKMFGDDATAAKRTGFVALNAAGQVLAGIGAGGLAAGAKGALIGGTANAAPAAIGVGVASTQSGTLSRAQKRLKTAIALYIPNQLSVRYGMQWSEEDTFAYQAAGAGTNAILKAMGTGGTQGLTKEALGDAAGVVGAMGLKSDKQGAAASAALGLAANPKKEQIFKGVDYRTFAFDYQFFPRDASEADNVMSIIKAFKYHMHPEFKDDNEFLYVYPSEFDVEYYANSKTNKYLHRHTSCVLTEMSVNYTPNGQFNTFENGQPTQINITLQFKELALLTNTKIDEGL
jgi:hypothetical protein